MRKTIGIVSEGPTDFLVLKAVIDKITGNENVYLPLQPKRDMLGQYGNGWKGVWRWCKETLSVEMIVNEITPHIDFVVIQMDGDVVRKEKEVHCLCESTVCEDKGKIFPLYCENIVYNCPIDMPCKSHNNNVDDIIKHGISVLKDTLNDRDKDFVIFTIPCDSTDTWVVAAYDEIDDVESLNDPWKNIIAKGKYYHGIRVRGDRKNTITYSVMANKVADNWNKIIHKCKSAMLLDQEIKRVGID